MMTDIYTTATRFGDRTLSRIADALPIWIVAVFYFFSRKRPIT